MNRFVMTEKPSRFLALVESILATLIWASSFVLVKLGLEHLGPFTVAGLRYFLAALLLLPFLIRNKNSINSLSPRLWFRLFLIGLSAYTIGNGALFWGLKYLSATTTSVLLSLSPVLILIMGVLWLKEIPTQLQVAGFIVTLAGSFLFFESGLKHGELLGIGIAMIALIGFTCFSILGREVARDQQTNTLTLTTIPLALGGGLLLVVAFPLEGLPGFSIIVWGIVLWLAIINTALAYILYNHSLQVLTALEMNVLFNLSPLGTAGLAWFILGEPLGVTQIAGIVIVIVGVILVQWKKQSH
jgi:drug/metabolite transporter (DMT)-like permease